MSYRFKRDESVEDGVRRIAGEQLAKAREELGMADRVEAVHQARKRCKKIRGLLRFVRPALGDQYDSENKRFRDIARRVSDVRDAQVMLETFDKLMDTPGESIDRRHFSPLRQQLVAERASISADALSAHLQTLDDDFSAAHPRITSLSLSRDGVAAWRGGFRKTYGRARDGCHSARRTLETDVWHDWRKRVKYHRFHCDLLVGAWPATIQARADELDHLGDLLGDEHDLAVLRSWIRAGDDKLRADNQTRLLRLIERRRNLLRTDSMRLGRCLFLEKPKPITRRTGACWQLWRD